MGHLSEKLRNKLFFCLWHIQGSDVVMRVSIILLSWYKDNCIIYDSTFSIILASLMILLSSIFYLLSHIQYTWESQLLSSNSPDLLSYCFEWTAINIHLYWSLCKIPGLTLIAFDWFHISLLEPPCLGKVEFNALLARPVSYTLKHLLHINKIELDWRRDYFPRENQVLTEEELIFDKKTLIIYHTWIDCSEKCLLV